MAFKSFDERNSNGRNSLNNNLCRKENSKEPSIEGIVNDELEEFRPSIDLMDVKILLSSSNKCLSSSIENYCFEVWILNSSLFPTVRIKIFLSSR